MEELFITIKTSWDRVTLSDFNKILAIQKEDNLEQFEKDLKILTVLTDLDEDDLDNMSITEVKNLINRTNFLNEPVSDVPLKKRYKLNGRRYSLNSNIYTLSGAQFTDLIAFVKDPTETENNLAWILSALLLPVKRKWFFVYTEKYLATKLEDIKNDILQMPFTDVKAISNFFLKVGQDSVKTTISYMQNRMNLELQSALKILNQNGNSYLAAQIQDLLTNGDSSI